MIRSSSNGGMTAAPFFSAISRATVSRVADVTPAVTTFAPYASVACDFHRHRVLRHDDRRLDAEELRGEGDALGVVAGGEGDDAAAFRWSSSSCSRAFIAPRILNEPARCRFSHLSRTSTPIPLRERTAGQEGRAVDVRADAAGRVADIFEGGDDLRWRTDI
jgi:hypothetical protein